MGHTIPTQLRIAAKVIMVVFTMSLVVLIYLGFGPFFAYPLLQMGYEREGRTW